MTGAVIPANFSVICPEKVDIAKALDMVEGQEWNQEGALAIRMHSPMCLHKSSVSGGCGSTG